MVFNKKKKKVEHKFCPVCGLNLDIDDSFCTRCRYSFINRAEKNKKKGKKIKLKNIIIILIIIAILYLGIRYLNKQPIIPRSLNDALSTFIPTKQNK